jgi:hypothetical protein
MDTFDYIVIDLGDLTPTPIEEGITVATDLNRLVSIMCNIISCDSHTLLHSRRNPYPSARALVARRLFDMGYRWSAIAEAMGKERTTIMYMTDKCADFETNITNKLVQQIAIRFNRIA